MTLNCGTIWTSVSEVIRQRISADGYERWFGDDVLDDGLKLVLPRAESDSSVLYREQLSALQVQDAAQEVLHSPRKIQFVAPGNADSDPSTFPLSEH